mgnify:CR=1 FL=1
MFYRNIFISLLLLNHIYAQSVFNAYGLGLSKSAHHTATTGAGSIGLVPTFHPGVSLDNPATWPGLKFTFISGSYNSRSVACLLYTSPSPRDLSTSRMPSSA